MTERIGEHGRVLLVTALLLLLPLQYLAREITDQEPFPALYLPGFDTTKSGDVVAIWVPSATVTDDDGELHEIDPYDLVEAFPTSKTSALANWFRTGLGVNGEPAPCSGNRFRDVVPDFHQSRCPGRTRSGEAVLDDPGMIGYLRSQLDHLPYRPVMLHLRWDRVIFDIGDPTPVASEPGIEIRVDFR